MGVSKNYDLKRGNAPDGSKKLPWYYAPVFCAFWLVLYLAVVVTQVNHLPDPLLIKDEIDNPEAFIAERARAILFNLTSIGPRVVGSAANEIDAVEFLLQQIESIRAQASDYFEFEVDVQEATGNYMHWTMINMYQSIQNVVVRLKSRDSVSDNYLLINSHFDSVPDSPGAGDDGSMVVVMLEVMRVISKFPRPLEHPIIFLFNGAEENPLQASHAFITQHRWAQNCKALVNLDAAGSGGREILFQSGPNNPWLMNYYRKVPHPFATSLGEEIFQADIIPSDTDFRIFRDYGQVPGLDMAYIFNGYVYHTEYDQFRVIRMGSLQHTGDNVLSLARSLSNAPELSNTTQYEEGHVIFYDFLGWFFMFYTQTTGVIINVLVCAVGLVAIATSLYFMSTCSGLSHMQVLQRYGIHLTLHLVSIVLGAGLSILVAVFMDGIGCSMSWFTQNWLIIGLYFCPMFFGMALLPALYLERNKKDPLKLAFRIQLFMHAHCLTLIVLTIVLTIIGIRSAYLGMLAVFFDIFALIVNLISKMHRTAYGFGITVMVSQILPFLYINSLTQAIYLTLIPMVGRSGSASNPEIMVAGIAIFQSIIFAGFLIPLFMLFHKTRTLVASLAGIAVIFIIIAVTPAGFPFHPKTSPQRYALLHSIRLIHAPDGTIKTEQSGILVYPQDRHIGGIDEYLANLGQKRTLTEYCNEEIYCGMPLFNHRWHKARDRSFWIPIQETPILPGPSPQLEMLNKTELNNPNQRNYQFSLSGPDHMTIFIEPKGDNRIINWSFNDTMIREEWQPPFFIYFSYGKDNRSLEFTIDVEGSEEPSLEIGIGGHWIHQNKERTPKYGDFINSFPDYATVTDWVASYESWFF